MPIDSSLTTRNIEGLSYPPTFNGGDMANIQSAEVAMGLAKPVQINYGLYEMSWWGWRKQRKAIMDSGILYYDAPTFPSDGSGMYVDMEFPKLSKGDSIGIMIPLPNGDGSDIEGFGW